MPDTESLDASSSAPFTRSSTSVAVAAMAAAAVSFGAYTAVLVAWFAGVWVAMFFNGDPGPAWQQALLAILGLLALIGVILVPVAAAVAVYRRATRANGAQAAGERPADVVKHRIGTRRNVTALVAAAAAVVAVIVTGYGFSRVVEQAIASTMAGTGPAEPGIETMVIVLVGQVAYLATLILPIPAAVATYRAMGGSTWRGMFALDRVAIGWGIVCCGCLAGLVVGFLMGLLYGELQPQFLTVAMDVFGTLGLLVGLAIYFVAHRAKMAWASLVPHG